MGKAEPLGDKQRVQTDLGAFTYRAVRPVAVALGVLYLAYLLLGEFFLTGTSGMFFSL